MTAIERITSFDKDHADALRSLWFLGDVHANFQHIAQALLDAPADPPSWIVFLGDIDIDHKPLSEILQPLRLAFASVQVALIHGNHDADTYDHWKCAIDGRGNDVLHIHANVVQLNGIRVAGLGGNFLGRVWSPPAAVKHRNYREATRGPTRQTPAPSFLGAIYPDDYDKLSRMRADLLLTHEAPGCHPFGFPVPKPPHI